MDFGRELAVCQRHFRRIRAPGNTAVVAIGQSVGSARPSSINFTIFGTEMRANSTASIQDGFVVYTHDNRNIPIISSSNMTRPIRGGGGGIVLQFSVDGAILAGTPCILTSPSAIAPHIDLSADL